MQMTVDTDEVDLDTSAYADQAGQGQVLILQNLGSGDLYFDFAPGVDETSGIKIASGGGYEVTNWTASSHIYLMSDTSADLRYTVAG